MLDRPFFLSEEVCLSPVTLYTLDQYREWFNDPGLTDQSLGFPKTEAKIQKWLIKITRNNRNKHFSILIGGENVGHIGLKEIDKGKKTGTLDLFLADSRFWEKNLAEGIFSWLKFFARTKLGLERLYIPKDYRRHEVLKRFLIPSGFVENDQGESLAFWIDL